jgi:hypothetical protein
MYILPFEELIKMEKKHSRSNKKSKKSKKIKKHQKLKTKFKKFENYKKNKKVLEEKKVIRRGSNRLEGEQEDKKISEAEESNTEMEMPQEDLKESKEEYIESVDGFERDSVKISVGEDQKFESLEKFENDIQQKIEEGMKEKNTSKDIVNTTVNVVNEKEESEEQKLKTESKEEHSESVEKLESKEESSHERESVPKEESISAKKTKDKTNQNVKVDCDKVKRDDSLNQVPNKENKSSNKKTKEECVVVQNDSLKVNLGEIKNKKNQERLDQKPKTINLENKKEKQQNQNQKDLSKNTEKNKQPLQVENRKKIISTPQIIEPKILKSTTPQNNNSNKTPSSTKPKKKDYPKVTQSNQKIVEKEGFVDKIKFNSLDKKKAKITIDLEEIKNTKINKTNSKKKSDKEGSSKKKINQNSPKNKNLLKTPTKNKNHLNKSRQDEKKSDTKNIIKSPKKNNTASINSKKTPVQIKKNPHENELVENKLIIQTPTPNTVKPFPLVLKSSESKSQNVINLLPKNQSMSFSIRNVNAKTNSFTSRMINVDNDMEDDLAVQTENSKDAQNKTNIQNVVKKQKKNEKQTENNLYKTKTMNSDTPNSSRISPNPDFRKPNPNADSPNNSDLRVLPLNPVTQTNNQSHPQNNQNMLVYSNISPINAQTPNSSFQNYNHPSFETNNSFGFSSNFSQTSPNYRNRFPGQNYPSYVNDSISRRSLHKYENGSDISSHKSFSIRGYGYRRLRFSNNRNNRRSSQSRGFNAPRHPREPRTSFSRPRLPKKNSPQIIETVNTEPNNIPDLIIPDNEEEFRLPSSILQPFKSSYNVDDHKNTIGIAKRLKRKGSNPFRFREVRGLFGGFSHKDNKRFPQAKRFLLKSLRLLQRKQNRQFMSCGTRSVCIDLRDNQSVNDTKGFIRRPKMSNLIPGKVYDIAGDGRAKEVMSCLDDGGRDWNRGRLGNAKGNFVISLEKEVNVETTKDDINLGKREYASFNVGERKQEKDEDNLVKKKDDFGVKISDRKVSGVNKKKDDKGENQENVKFCVDDQNVYESRRVVSDKLNEMNTKDGSFLMKEEAYRPKYSFYSDSKNNKNKEKNEKEIQFEKSLLTLDRNEETSESPLKIPKNSFMKKMLGQMEEVKGRNSRIQKNQKKKQQNLKKNDDFEFIDLN